MSPVQPSTPQVVVAIQEIGRTVTEVRGLSTNVAAAIEEQGATTQEIVRSISRAASGTSEATHTVAELAAADGTGTAANQVLGRQERFRGSQSSSRPRWPASWTRCGLRGAEGPLPGRPVDPVRHRPEAEWLLRTRQAAKADGTSSGQIGSASCRAAFPA